MNAQNDNDLSRLLEGKWGDEYLTTLAIYDHIHEISVLRDFCIKQKTAEKLTNLENKLMDLFVLLSVWAKDEPDLYKQRLKLFLEQLDNKPTTKEIENNVNKKKTKTKAKR